MEKTKEPVNMFKQIQGMSEDELRNAMYFLSGYNTEAVKLAISHAKGYRSELARGTFSIGTSYD